MVMKIATFFTGQQGCSVQLLPTDWSKSFHIQKTVKTFLTSLTTGHKHVTFVVISICFHHK